MDDTHEAAIACGKIKAKDFGSFYPSFSAYAEKPMSLDITAVGFSSNTAHKGLDYWTNETAHHAPEIFKKIHYLRAFGEDEKHHLVDTDITSPEQWDGLKNTT
jgi:hypothetical protein